MPRPRRSATPATPATTSGLQALPARIGAELVREHKLGLGLVAITRLQVVPPQDPPPSGDEWPSEIDWPGVEGTLYLPADEWRDIVPALRAQDVVILDGKLTDMWGEYTTMWSKLPRARWRAILVRRLVLSEAIREVELALQTALDACRGVLARREDRLRRRERTVAAALSDDAAARTLAESDRPAWRPARGREAALRTRPDAGLHSGPCPGAREETPPLLEIGEGDAALGQRVSAEISAEAQADTTARCRVLEID